MKIEHNVKESTFEHPKLTELLVSQGLNKPEFTIDSDGVHLRCVKGHGLFSQVLKGTFKIENDGPKLIINFKGLKISGFNLSGNMIEKLLPLDKFHLAGWSIIDSDDQIIITNPHVNFLSVNTVDKLLVIIYRIQK